MWKKSWKLDKQVDILWPSPDSTKKIEYNNWNSFFQTEYKYCYDLLLNYIMNFHHKQWRRDFSVQTVMKRIKPWCLYSLCPNIPNSRVHTYTFVYDICIPHTHCLVWTGRLTKTSRMARKEQTSKFGGIFVRRVYNSYNFTSFIFLKKGTRDSKSWAILALCF